jgi:hypothetical protein
MDMTHRRDEGNIVWNDKWTITPEIKAAIIRLSELGVNIGTAITKHKANYSLSVPYDLPASTYVEIGYLIALLSDTDFPYGFWNYNTISGVESKVLGDRTEDVAPIEYDADPDGYKIRIYLREDREQFKINAEKRKAMDPDNHIEKSRARVFISLKLSGMSIEQISEKTGADPTMIKNLIKNYSKRK